MVNMVDRYIAKTSLEHRKNYGQFFTPPLVADLMVKWISLNRPKNILDPAFGAGVFYESASKILNDSFFFDAYEVDEQVCRFIPRHIKKKYYSLQ